MSRRGAVKEGRSLLVKNLRYETSPHRVRSVFEQFGQIRDVYLPLDHETHKPRGFGFVEFFDERDAQTAAREMDRANLDGNEITVIIAQDRRKSPETMRQLMLEQGSSPRFRRRMFNDDGPPQHRRSDGGGPPPYRRRPSSRSSSPRRNRRGRSRSRDDDRRRYRSRSSSRSEGRRRRDGRYREYGRGERVVPVQEIRVETEWAPAVEDGYDARRRPPTRDARVPAFERYVPVVAHEEFFHDPSRGLNGRGGSIPRSEESLPRRRGRSVSVE